MGILNIFRPPDNNRFFSSKLQMCASKFEDFGYWGAVAFVKTIR